TGRLVCVAAVTVLTTVGPSPTTAAATDSFVQARRPTSVGAPFPPMHPSGSSTPSPADLSTCDREPIHVPNLIQPHGAMLVVDGEAPHAVEQASANIVDFVGQEAVDLVGLPLNELLPESDARDIAAAIARDDLDGAPVRVAYSNLVKSNAAGQLHDGLFNILAHRNPANNGRVILEIEPADGRGDEARTQPLPRSSALHHVQRSIARLHKEASLQSFCDRVADEIRRLTGFDRVMVYRFDSHYNGQVFAESIAPQMQGTIEPFLHLHYPASDIPAQARRLYRKQWMRLIADVNYKPVPMVPPSFTELAVPVPAGGSTEEATAGRQYRAATQAPLDDRVDMSFAALRGISPIHIEYLQNMGVGATMTISLLNLRDPASDRTRDLLEDPSQANESEAGPRLWGLIACHHYSTPKFVDFDTRAACELYGQVVSMHLSTQLTGQRHEDAAERRRTLGQLSTRLSDLQLGLDHVLCHDEPTIADLIDCGGAAIVQDGHVTRLGHTPPEHIVRSMAEWAQSVAEARLAEKQGGIRRLDVVRTEALANAAPQFDQHLDTAAGILVIPFENGDAVCWFRPEHVRTIAWGGNPEKAVEVDRTDGTVRVSPRKSFAKWQQALRGQSLPWTETEVLAAAELRDAIISVLLKMNENLARINRQLAMSNDELDSFAYAASHDLREPLRGITNLSAFVMEDYAEQLGATGAEQLQMIQKLSGRMDALISSLLQYSRVGRLELELTPVDLEQLVDDEVAAAKLLLQKYNGTVTIERPLPTVQGDAVRLGEVFSNLISNALKYNQSDKPHITIGVSHDHPDVEPDDLTGQKPPAIFVRDNGIGIEPRHHADVFRIFRRLHQREAYDGGTGAGLTIVERVVRRHGGRIWVESDPAEKPGATFWFTLSGHEPDTRQAN
ncbi:MAG: ATP-binding protein, partial [Planctomycetota bacterium]